MNSISDEVYYNGNSCTTHNFYFNVKVGLPFFSAIMEM